MVPEHCLVPRPEAGPVQKASRVGREVLLSKFVPSSGHTPISIQEDRFCGRRFAQPLRRGIDWVALLCGGTCVQPGRCHTGSVHRLSPIPRHWWSHAWTATSPGCGLASSPVTPQIPSHPRFSCCCGLPAVLSPRAVCPPTVGDVGQRWLLQCAALRLARGRSGVIAEP